MITYGSRWLQGVGWDRLPFQKLLVIECSLWIRVFGTLPPNFGGRRQAHPRLRPRRVYWGKQVCCVVVSEMTYIMLVETLNPTSCLISNFTVKVVRVTKCVCVFCSTINSSKESLMRKLILQPQLSTGRSSCCCVFWFFCLSRNYVIRLLM